MPVIQTYFLDTNVLVKVSEYLRMIRERGDPRKLESYYTFLQQVIRNGHRVVISRISILEMYFLYHRWCYYDKKSKERAPFNEIFGRQATYELENPERVKIESTIANFIHEILKLGIEFSNIDGTDVLQLAEILYRGSKPSVEPYNLSIYANSILECSKCLVTDDGMLRKAIDYLRKYHRKEVRREIINRFGKGKYPYWAGNHDLPEAQKPR